MTRETSARKLEDRRGETDGDLRPADSERRALWAGRAIRSELTIAMNEDAFGARVVVATTIPAISSSNDEIPSASSSAPPDSSHILSSLPPPLFTTPPPAWAPSRT